MGKDKLVYHYCSMSTFEAIIKNKTLRLSDITKSNDSMEIRWIVQHINELFKSEYYREKAKYFKNNFDEILWTKMVNKGLSDYFEPNTATYSYFVCCFSTEGDLLSQWRGYADDGKGVSLGFSKEILSQVGKPPKEDGISDDILKFDKVIYSKQTQQSKVRTLVKKLIKNLKKQFPKGNTYDTRSEGFMFPVIGYFDECFLDLFKKAIFQKNSFFREEHEYRLCYWGDKEHDDIARIPLQEGFRFSPFKYICKEKDVVQFIDLIFEENEDILQNIILGPKNKADVETIDNYLKSLGIKNCTVEKSKGTYQ